ncbi:hypothetical protein SLEP1_g12096 [Rubroshorea leprosula]|nr:hypothetical protein SLEP1_g12096 [Rubroshorea leprosula]
MILLYSWSVILKKLARRMCGIWILAASTMCGDKFTFSDLDESCQDKVKFGDNSTIAVKGRGKALQQKKMVNGLPHFDSPSEICEICMSTLPKEFWPEAINWGVHILNRSPTSPLPDMMPEEAWSGHKPAIDYFRIFGVSDQSKTYKLYNPLTKKVIISHDVVFDEASTWSWTEKFGQQIPENFENGKDMTVQNSEGQTQQTGGLTSADLKVSRQIAEKSLLVAVELSTGGSLPTTPELEFGTSSRPQYKKRRPTWLEDYEVTDLPQNDVPVTHFALFANCDPLTYEEVVKEEKWQKAMAEEIGSIERNQTWELTDFLEGHKTSGVKWIYKTKLKKNGKVDKFKARLVAKGYKQEFGIDYQEAFSPVARMDTIRLVITLAAQNSWPIYQLDVKSAFLHGNLQEQVFIDQPSGYVKSGFEHKEVLDKFQMKNYKSVTTPIDKGVKLIKDPGGKSMDNKLYK